MKNRYKLIITFILAMLLVVGCEDRSDLTAPAAPDTGNADFTTFISIGNSLTAGYQNASLYESSQVNSFGALIAGQVGTDYAQPLMSNPGIAGRLEIGGFDNGLPVLTPNTNQGTPTNLTYAGIYNNLGIPGILLADVLLTTSSPSNYVGENQLIDVVLRGQGTVLDQALAKHPTFTTVWIGNNDILGHATQGGLLPFTPVETFTQLYNQLIGALAQAGSKGAVANIPGVSNTPYFTTVGPTVGVTLNTLGLNLFYQKNGETVATGVVGANDLINLNVLMTLPGSSYASLIGDTQGLYYQMTGKTPGAGIDTNQPFGLHPQNPWPDGLTLDADEIANVNSVISGYNTAIQNAANTFGFAYVDVNGFFENLAASGKVINGIPFTTAYISGNTFSLDGVHPTTPGYGVVANEFIKAINAKYNASIPLINVSTLPASIPLKSSSSNAKLTPGALDNLQL